MAMRDDLERAEGRLRDEARKHEATKEKLRLAEEELQHFRTAVAAVKWLWDKASDATPFQI